MKMSSREFNQKTNIAKTAAAEGPVIVTERGKPTHVLLTYDAYERLNGGGRSAADALACPDAADIDFDPPRLEISLKVPDFG